MKLLILILLATTLTSSAQIFEGKMTYSNTYQSKLPNLKSEQLNSMMGTKQEYYIKGNNYKSLFNGLFTKMQIYQGEENRSYTLTAKSDTLYWEDYSKNKDVVVNFETQKNKDTIMNISCDVLIVSTDKSKTYYYYSSKYGINPEMFIKHNYGNWYYIVSKTKALPLKTVHETAQFILTSTAIEIKPMELGKQFFDILDKNKTAPATW